MDNEIKQFVDQMMPAFNQGYKQWHEKEWKEFISKVRDQFKQEVIDELLEFAESKTNPRGVWKEDNFYIELAEAIEIIKNK